MPIPNPHVKLRGQSIAKVTKTTFFDVIEDLQLNWKEQIFNVAEKLSKSVASCTKFDIV